MPPSFWIVFIKHCEMYLFRKMVHFLLLMLLIPYAVDPRTVNTLIDYQLPIHETHMNKFRVKYYCMYVDLIWSVIPFATLMQQLSIISETLHRWRTLWDQEGVLWWRRVAEGYYLESTLIWRHLTDDSLCTCNQKLKRIMLPRRVDLYTWCLSFLLFFILLLSGIYKYF